MNIARSSLDLRLHEEESETCFPIIGTQLFTASADDVRQRHMRFDAEAVNNLKYDNLLRQLKKKFTAPSHVVDWLREVFGCDLERKIQYIDHSGKETA